MFLNVSTFDVQRLKCSWDEEVCPARVIGCVDFKFLQKTACVHSHMSLVRPFLFGGVR